MITLDVIWWKTYYGSTKGVGRTAPDLSEARALDDGVLVPEGKPKENPHHEVLGITSITIYDHFK